MNRPIQVKPADSENRAGMSHVTCVVRMLENLFENKKKKIFFSACLSYCSHLKFFTNTLATFSNPNELRASKQAGEE